MARKLIHTVTLTSGTPVEVADGIDFRIEPCGALVITNFSNRAIYAASDGTWAWVNQTTVDDPVHDILTRN